MRLEGPTTVSRLLVQPSNVLAGASRFVGALRLADPRTGFALEGSVSNPAGALAPATLFVRFEVKHATRLPFPTAAQNVSLVNQDFRSAAVQLQGFEIPLRGIRFDAFSPYVGAAGGTLRVSADKLGRVSAQCAFRAIP